MTAPTKPNARADATQLEPELLARLGLSTQASSQDVETAHDELVRFLESAPHELRSWAQREIAAADEAYALLSDPTTDPARQLDPIAIAPTPVAVALPVADEEEYFEEFEEIDREPPKTRRARREVDRQARAAGQRAAAGQPGTSSRSRLVRRLAIGAAVVVGAVAIALGGYSLGAPSVPGFTGTPAPEASGAGQIDQAKVAELMKKLQANPKDIPTLQQLGDVYFQAGDYNTAGGWMEKILAIDPRNVTARLALGAALFNLGKAPDAEKQWRQVLTVDPKNVEAHYDLGFLYLSQNPPDVVNVRAEWNKVIEIAPDSDVAKTVATHLRSLEGSPAPSSVASPAASPSASPAASPTASGN